MTDPKTVRKWLAAYNRGQSYRAVAAADGVNESTVRRALRDQPRLPRRPGPRQRERPAVERVVAAWHALGSIRLAACALEMSRTFVQARLAEAGLVEHPDKRPRKRPRISVLQ